MSEREKNAWNEIDEQAAREGSARRREFHHHFTAAATSRGIGVHSTSMGKSRGMASRPASGRFDRLVQHTRAA